MPGVTAGPQPNPWEGVHLAVIDPQVIFADPASAWAAPDFAGAMGNISALAPLFAPRTIVTRWLPTASRSTGWGPYFAQWPFADVPPTDPLYDLVPAAVGLSGEASIDLPTFGKWCDELAHRLGVAAQVTGGETASSETGGGIVAAQRADDPLAAVHGPARLLLTGVATDCCVVSTALAAADAGVLVTVVSDACAGSDADSHAQALHLMGLYAPLIDVTTTQAVLAAFNPAVQDDR